MSRPLLLDLFCGGGGAAMGYHRAGFDVVGVDIGPQPHYPFRFIQADAMTFSLDGFDAIHASPPCQAYSAGKNIWKGRLAEDRHPDLVDATRERLVAAGVPYVIENVVGAPLRNYIVLCGDSFGLGVKRHRLFETSFMVWNPPQCRPGHPLFFVSVFGGGAKAKKKGRGFPKTNIVHARASEAMGIDWMTRDELSQAIPPAFTEYLGQFLLAAVHDAGGHQRDDSSLGRTGGTSAFPGHKTGSHLSRDDLGGSESFGYLPLSTSEANGECSPASNRDPDVRD